MSASNTTSPSIDDASPAVAHPTSEESLRLALEASDTGLWTWNTRTDAVTWSPECNRIHGLVPGAFDGTREAFFQLVHPDDRPRVAAKLRAALESHTLYECEFRIVRPSGEVVWVANRGRAKYDADGRTLDVLGTITDIDERKRADEARRDAEERLQLAILAGGVATWDLDLLTGRNLWSDSHFTLLGWEPTPTREVNEEIWSDLVVPEDRARVVATWQRAEREHELFRSQHRLRCVGGGSLWVSATGRFFYDDGGRALRFLGVFVDVTEAREGQARLEEADRHKDEFLAMLAHELRNPLAPIRHALELLRREATETGAVAKLRDMMERQMRHMVRLVDDMLDVSRIRLGKVELARERISVQAVLEHAVESSRPLMEARRHAFTVRVPEAPLWVDGDLTRLAQVVGNLLNNAAKYTPPGGHIELGARVEEGSMLLHVTDDGAGISPQMLPRVFDLFVQDDGTRDSAQGGLGLGLSLVRTLVEMHGGTVVAESPGLGHGSTLTVRLPLARRAADEATALAAPDPRGSDTCRRVLIVDDNADGAEALAMLLELAGHAATTADGGPAALEAARAQPPEVVFLDIGLPGMDGYEVARRLRADPRTAGAVLVALTGWGSEEDKRRSRDAGFDMHLTKPVDPAAVAEALARVSSQQHRGAQGEMDSVG